MTDHDYLLKFWGKTSHDDAKPNAFHPLICHLIDVGMVAKKMWDEVLPTATKRRLTIAFGEAETSEQSIEKIGRLVAFIAGLHDLGKCSPPFQLRGLNRRGDQTEKLLELYRSTEFWQDAPERAIDAPHGYVTAVELPRMLETHGFNPQSARQIGILIGGHHGVFPTSTWENDLRRNRKLVGNENNDSWENARCDLTGVLAELISVETIQQSPDIKLDNGSVMILAGLVSVADWIGSNTDYFDCAAAFDGNGISLSFQNLREYLAASERNATTALTRLGWRNWTEYQTEKSFKTLFPFEPRGLQTQAIEIAKELTDQGIVVIESPMGEGKTEAAMFLADHFNCCLKQRGIYFALPTQATSNQMFGRVRNFLLERFDEKLINLQLLHGHSSLSAEFETLKAKFDKIKGIYEECEGDNCVPQVVAAEWFTYRKRGLLAPFGVGTIDQALMAVLQTKHVFVGLFGLAHKTIIIDEVHAYDAYMSTLLERLLEWLAALGSPVILLSATLPKSRRDALIKAYQKGLGVSSPHVSKGSAGEYTTNSVSKTRHTNETVDDLYPRISYATDSTIKVKHIEKTEKTQTLHIRSIDENFIDDLKEKLKDGGCVAIICNTVGRSQEIYQALLDDKFFADKIDLLHSRFRFCDREDREKRILERFGKPDENGESPNRPNFAVLIATQIIEQSLDLDFDLMISDLAPIDLLLQRAGRLHRHKRNRPSEFNQAELWIIQADIKDDMPDFGVSEYVYAKHILLRTWLELQSIKQIEIPGEIEKLVEAVYDKKRVCFDEQFQTCWDETKTNMSKKLNEKRLKAKACRITDSDDEDLFENVILQLDEDNPETHKTFQALTRDSDLPSVSIIVLSYDETKSIDLDATPTKEIIEFVLRREAKMSKMGLTHLIIADETLKQQSWKNSALLRHHRLLNLDEDNEIVIGSFKVSLDENLGILIRKNRC